MTADNLPPRLYYRLDEAAQLLGCTESDLLHWGANEEIALLIHVNDLPATIGLWLPRDLEGGFMWDDVMGIAIDKWSFLYKEHPRPPIIPFRGGSYIGKVGGLMLLGSVAARKIEAGEPIERAYLYGVEEFDSEFEVSAARRYGSPDGDIEFIAKNNSCECVVCVIATAPIVPTAKNLFISAAQLRKLSLTPSQPTTQKPRTSSKTLNRQRDFAKQLSGLFGRAVAADDSSEPMTIIMELLEGSQYAHMIHSPYELHTALDYLASRPPSKRPLCISDEALARWIKAHTQHSQRSQH